MGDDSGSKASPGAATASPPIGYDPGRVERACRALCGAAEQDPDEQTIGPSPSSGGVTYDVAIYVPRWRLKEQFVRDVLTVSATA